MNHLSNTEFQGVYLRQTHLKCVYILLTIILQVEKITQMVPLKSQRINNTMRAAMTVNATY